MDKGATKEPVTSTPVWDELEEWTRGRIQEWMQQLLVQEVSEFLGAQEVPAPRGGDAGLSERLRQAAAADDEERTVTVRRPRVRDVEERFAGPSNSLDVLRIRTEYFSPVR